MESEKQFVLWDEIIKYFEMAMKLFEGMDETFLNREFVDNFFNYFKGLRLAKKEKRPVVMTNFCFPPEIIYALNGYPMCQEIGSVALSIANAGLKYIDLAEEHGIDKAQCNAQKVWIGASMVGEAPLPDYIIYGSQPCDSTNSQYQIFKQIYDYAPVYTLDIPYWSYEPKSDYYDADTAPYVGKQLKNLISWFEEKANRKMDHTQFIATIENSNKTRELILESMELMKAVPAPLPSASAFNNYAALLTSSGLPETIKYAQWVRDTAKEMVKNKQGALEIRGRKEKIRVMWMYLPIFFETLFFDWMERRFGAVSVMDMMGYTMSQPINMKNDDTIFEGLAKQVLDAPMGRQSRGSMEFYLDDILKICKDYKIDCAIYGGHVGCKHSLAIARLMKELIESELGIPVLIFEVDCIDSRVVPGRAIKRKLKFFFKSNF